MRLKEYGLGCWESREGIIGEVRRVEMKRRRRMKRRSKVPKIFFLFAAKTKEKIKLTQVGTN